MVNKISKKKKIIKYSHTIEDEIESYGNAIKIRQIDIEYTYSQKPPFYKKKKLEEWNKKLNNKLNKIEELKSKQLDLFIELDNSSKNKKKGY